MNALNKPIRVMVVDDHQLIIDGLKSILQDEEDIAFAGGANNLQQALDFLQNHQVHVLVVDINMPDISGIELTRLVRRDLPHIHVLALTMHENITMINRMIEAGASGYILKRTNMNEVLEAIRVVAGNGKYLGRDVQALMMDSLAKNDARNDQTKNRPSLLTRREKEILALVAKEYSNGEIAEKLYISERTVETHRRNIFTKTKTKTIVGLIKYAIREGLVSQDNDPAR